MKSFQVLSDSYVYITVISTSKMLNLTQSTQAIMSPGKTGTKNETKMDKKWIAS